MLYSTFHDRSRVWIAAALIAAAGAVCYANSLHGSFVFDDAPYVAENKALRQLWPPDRWLMFCPTRPVVYFTFAVNRALHGTDVVGYHVVNIAVHLLTALGLFGVVRRTCLLPQSAERYRRAAEPLATAVALVWVIHPLCTQAVTYVYQRLESLAAMFAVLCLYAFVRAYDRRDGARRGWIAISIMACYLGMLSKESVFGLPLIVLCYDRLFLAGSWRKVLAHRWYYAALFCSCIVLAALMSAISDRYARAGIADVAGLTPWSYALSQSGVLLHYLRLSFWPTGLCLDYGWPPARHAAEYVPQTAAILILLATTAVGLYRGRAWSFPAVAFFLLLAPTSSIVPIADLAFEHRMYLPLACVVTLVALAVFELAQRPGAADATGRSRPRFIVATTLGIALIAALAWGTIERNRDYQTPESIWRANIAHAPGNPRGYYLFATKYLKDHQPNEGRKWLAESLRVDPTYPGALILSASLLIDEKRLDEAEDRLRRVVPTASYQELFLITTGNLLAARHRPEEAARAFTAALQENPESAAALTNLGLLHDAAGLHQEAAAHYLEALAVNPEYASAHNNLGMYYASLGRTEDAVVEFRAALAGDRHHVQARANLGAMLSDLGLHDEAIRELRQAVADDPSYVGGYINLANVLAHDGLIGEAVMHLERAVELDPENATARENLAELRRSRSSPTAADIHGIAAP